MSFLISFACGRMVLPVVIYYNSSLKFRKWAYKNSFFIASSHRGSNKLYCYDLWTNCLILGNSGLAFQHKVRLFAQNFTGTGRFMLMDIWCCGHQSSGLLGCHRVCLFFAFYQHVNHARTRRRPPCFIIFKCSKYYLKIHFPNFLLCLSKLFSTSFISNAVRDLQ